VGGQNLKNKKDIKVFDPSQNLATQDFTLPQGEGDDTERGDINRKAFWQIITPDNHGDYLSRQEKLEKISQLKSISGIRFNHSPLEGESKQALIASVGG
jgi:hypothetical protein